MPYKSKVRKRKYQREYMRRRRGSNSKGESKAKKRGNVSPDVSPKVRAYLRPRRDFVTKLPGGEEMYGFEEVFEQR